MATILIVDDEAHILRVTSMWLRRHGYEVLEAVNGSEGLKLFADHEIDLIISDMNMPVMDGLDLAKAVREECKSDVPFLLLSARCDREALADKLAPFNVRLYPKPFVPSRLVADVQEMLGRKSKESVSP